VGGPIEGTGGIDPVLAGVGVVELKKKERGIKIRIRI